MFLDLLKELERKKLTISTAESCTGGLLSSQITSVNGSSKVFLMGLVTYSNQSKIKILKISKSLIKKYGAVSEKCCYSMAKNLSKISKSSIAISITGIAGPGGGSPTKPVGLVYIGICKDNTIFVRKFLFKKSLGRIGIQKKTCEEAIKIIKGTI
jgi:nicotinamide-nucleotide amidase